MLINTSLAVVDNFHIAVSACLFLLAYSNIFARWRNTAACLGIDKVICV